MSSMDRLGKGGAIDELDGGRTGPVSMIKFLMASAIASASDLSAGGKTRGGVVSHGRGSCCCGGGGIVWLGREVGTGGKFSGFGTSNAGAEISRWRYEGNSCSAATMKALRSA